MLEPGFGPVQQQAVESDAPALIAEGPPGSGKSRVLRWRVVRLAGEGEPVSAIAMGVSVLGETLELREIAGTAVILLALLIIDGRMVNALRVKFS